jgi:hypothetical protein
VTPERADWPWVLLALQNFREPLYLADAPQYREDPRSEEQRKYPTLFRQQIAQLEARPRQAAAGRLKGAGGPPAALLPAAPQVVAPQD